MPVQTECVFRGLHLMFPLGELRAILQSFIHRLERKLPEIQKVNLCVCRDDWNKRFYSIELIAISPTDKARSSVQTVDVINGLLLLINEVFDHFEESKKSRDLELINRNLTRANAPVFTRVSEDSFEKEGFLGILHSK